MSTSTDIPPIGFAGLGRMGLPMVRRLCAAGHRVTVWNRSEAAMAEAHQAGANVSDSFAALVRDCPVICLMLANAEVLDALLERDDTRFALPLAGRTLIQLGTTSAEQSATLARAAAAAGARYIEAPVSGSRIPAEQGKLVAMIGASDEAGFTLAERVVPAFAERSYRCGAPPAAMRMKLAVNNYLITMVMGLAEAWTLAGASNLDLATFRAILDAGPMASAVSQGKLAKLASDDMAAQASIADVLMNADLVAEATRLAGLDGALVTASQALLRRAVEAGLGQSDMIAVARILDPQGRAA